MLVSRFTGLHVGGPKKFVSPQLYGPTTFEGGGLLDVNINWFNIIHKFFDNQFAADQLGSRTERLGLLHLPAAGLPTRRRG